MKDDTRSRYLSAGWITLFLLAATAAATGQPNDQTPPSRAQSPPAAQAEPPAPSPAREPSMFDLRNAKQLTGDWGGGRTQLKDAGIDVRLKVINEFMLNVHGGRETKNGHDFGGSYDLDLILDFEKMGLVPGGTLFIRGKGTWGGDDSDFDREKIGGLFRTNQDAGTEEPLFVDKWWWQQMLFEDRLELRFGRLDILKDLIDLSPVMGNEDDFFLNGALVRNGTLPSAKALSLYANWSFTEHAYIRALVADANTRDRQTNFNTAFHGADEFRVYLELGCLPNLKSAKGGMPGSYRVGTWFDPTTKVRNFNTLGGRLAPRTDSNDWGAYLGFDQMVWKENADEKDKQGASVAARYGWASGEVNRIEHFWALAAQYQGLIDGRDKDILGIGMAQGIMADELRRIDPRADRETVYELYYSYQAAPWLIISPDFQFIHNAGGLEDNRTATVFGLRVKITL